MGVCVVGICLDEFDDLEKMKPQRAASDHGVAPSIVCWLGGSAGEGAAAGGGQQQAAGGSRRRPEASPVLCRHPAKTVHRHRLRATMVLRPASSAGLAV